MASVGSLEEEARKRKERLRALSRKTKGDEAVGEKNESDSTEKEKLPRYSRIIFCWIHVLIIINSTIVVFLVQTIPLVSDSKFGLFTRPPPPSPCTHLQCSLHSFCAPVSVCVCVHRCGVQGIKIQSDSPSVTPLSARMTSHLVLTISRRRIQYLNYTIIIFEVLM